MKFSTCSVLRFFCHDQQDSDYVRRQLVRRGWRAHVIRPDYQDVFRKAAIFVDKILKGANPAELPIEQPTKFELVLNMKVAKALGREIPSLLIALADKVIE